MKQAIEQEAEEQELSPTEYMREILRNRKQNTTQHSPEDSPTEYSELVDRIDELEKRVAELERTPEIDESPLESTESDLLEYVANNAPVSKSDIEDNCYPESEARKPDTWYRKEALPELKQSRFEYLHNVGWE